MMHSYEELSPAVRMRELLYGHVLSRALCAVTVLGVPDALAAGGRDVPELAGEVGADAEVLGQVLRALAAFDVLSVSEQSGATRVELTPLGRTLCRDRPGSLWYSAALAHDLVGDAWNGMVHSLRTGKPAFQEIAGEDFFTHLAREPRLREVFDRSQRADLTLWLEEILAAVDFGRHRVVLDAGGGDGEFLSRVLVEHPALRGIVAETANVVPKARERLAEAGVQARARAVECDFFSAVPGGADVCLLRDVLHDWSDEQSVRILRRCKEGLGAAGRVLVIERVAGGAESGSGDDRMAALMSLYMLSVVGGTERTIAEFEELFVRAGLPSPTVHRLPGGVVVDASWST